MIPIQKEPEGEYKLWGVYENCVFCKQNTKTWHVRTNNPVCPSCSKKHSVSELADHFKNGRKKAVKY